MKTILGASVLVICLSAVYGLVDEKDFSPKLVALAHSLHTTCLGISGCKEEQVGLLKQGKFENPAECEGKYVSCLWTASGLMNSNLDVNRKLLEELMPDSVKGTETSIYNSCLEETKKQGEKDFNKEVWFLMKCIYNADPKNFIMF
ncbi:uncharacterized protein [Diabrotica undecimpunctata]|uniref:uncharacterized protein n=1 Tax=Diabrotica undecimpunctata TaxID=50387 RepID=UPI003B6395EC